MQLAIINLRNAVLKLHKFQKGAEHVHLSASDYYQLEGKERSTLFTSKLKSAGDEQKEAWINVKVGDSEQQRAKNLGNKLHACIPLQYS